MLLQQLSNPDVLPPLQDYFELGVILLRKKLYTQATKNLEKAKKTWRGEPDELAQVTAGMWPLLRSSCSPQACLTRHGDCQSSH